MIHLIYSDVHMKPENLQWCRVVFDEIEKAAHEEGVIESGGYVLNNGDLFNERGVIRTGVFDCLATTRRRWAEKRIKHIDNIGNHDQEDREGSMHPLRIFDALPGSMVIEKPTFIEGVRWHIFPYSHRLKDQLFEESSHSARPHQVCFSHAGIKNAFRNDKSQDTDGIALDCFKGFKRVFVGHYHFRHEFENIYYVGSPMQHSHAEAGQAKGMLIYNDQTNKVTFREIKGTPRHYKINMTWRDGKQHIGLEAGVPSEIDKVEFAVSGPGDQVRLVTREYLKTKVKAQTIKITRNTEDEAVSRISFEDKDQNDLGTLLEKYIDHLEPTLDRGLLLSVGKDLMTVSPAKL